MEFLGVSLAAWMSILALAIVIIISCVNEELHVGNLAIAFGIVVGAIFMNMPASKVVMTYLSNVRTSFTRKCHDIVYS